jgi:hypothetical protein
MQQRTSDNIPLIFNGFPLPYMVMICKAAQDELNEANPDGIYAPTPFVNKTDFGCQATFRSKLMADKVEEIVETTVTQEFDISSQRAIQILFHMATDTPGEFIIYLELNEGSDDSVLFIWHRTEGYAESLIKKMNTMYEKYMIDYPITLVSDLIDGCSIPLNEDEKLMVPCKYRTLLIPMKNKEEEFFKEFSSIIKRIKEVEIECKGIQFHQLKQICQEIGIKGVFYFIANEKVILTGLQFHLKKFSDILKRHIRDEITEKSRVLSRK